jgi:hypothetical protein
MSAPNEGTLLQLDNALTSSNGQVNGAVRIVSSAGATAIPDAALPTVNGNYVLKVLNGVYSWIAETP